MIKIIVIATIILLLGGCSFRMFTWNDSSQMTREDKIFSYEEEKK